MRLHVDVQRCEGHGMCVLSAPEVFDLDDDGILHWTPADGALPDPVPAAVRSAVDVCPVAALRLHP